MSTVALVILKVTRSVEHNGTHHYVHLGGTWGTLGRQRQTVVSSRPASFTKPVSDQPGHRSIKKLPKATRRINCSYFIFLL